MKRATKRPTKLLATSLLAIAGLAVSAGPADAQQMRCGKRDKVVGHLASKYGETRHSIGLQQGRGVVELFANAESGSWTILLTTPQGVSCLIASGDAYQALQDELADTPA